MANSRLCSILGCGNNPKAKGFCEKHYERIKKHGDPYLGAAITQSGELQEYYKTVVLSYEGDECLIWPYGRNLKGYGVMGKNSKMRLVSRLACEEANGPPPTPEHEAAHSCGRGTFGCVTKKHLNWKTHTENMADKLTHGTHNRGERHGNVKLTEAQAREIIALNGKESKSVTAKTFGVSRTTVSFIQSGHRWGWIT